MPGDRNRTALERTLAELRRMGRLADVDAAQVAIVESLADAVDETPGNAQLWKQYREAVSSLLEENPDGDSRLDDALAALRSASSVGDAPPC